ncbi:MAG: YihY/virulence factor BrkB family protein [Candidatus Coproplasma sp.]
MRTIIKEFRYYSDKRFTTLSGTLVYFFLMSVTPFFFWLALIVGDFDLSRFLSDDLFSVIQPVIGALQQAAVSATGSATLILLLTSLWSSTNFFYHLRRSGEIIFAPNVKTGAIKLRISAMFAVFAILLIAALAAVTPFLGVNVLEMIMPRPIAEAITMIFLTMFAFFASYFLNVFACPYKLNCSQASGGALLTVILWILFAIGFKVYLQFSNPQRLYGAITAVIVFLLWCYLMINSLVIGLIYNSKYLIKNSILDAASAGKRTGTDMAGNR